MAEYAPIDLVLKLSEQGKNEQEIVSQLRLQGFTPKQIDSAMKEAIKREVTESPAPAQVGPPMPLGLSPGEQEKSTSKSSRPTISAGLQPMPMSRRPEPVRPPATIPQQAPQPPVQQLAGPPTSISPFPMRGSMGAPTEKISIPEQMRPMEISEISPRQPTSIRRAPEQLEVSVEELIEAVVNERWAKFEEKLSAFEAREIAVQQEVSEFRKQIEEMRREASVHETNIFERFDEFGSILEKTQTRIGSIESAFREFVPALAENVKELSNVVERLKRGK